MIAWFVVITRFEPSILRTGVMAGLSATAFMTGRERSPSRILALAVTGLLLVDPLLLWSIGFWLSVGATALPATVDRWPGVLAQGAPTGTARRIRCCGPVTVRLRNLNGRAPRRSSPILVCLSRLARRSPNGRCQEDPFEHDDVVGSSGRAPSTVHP